MRIVMVGSGCIGPESGACFADFGHNVICVDKAEEKIEAPKNGIILIFEPGIDALVETNVKSDRHSQPPIWHQPMRTWRSSRSARLSAVVTSVIYGIHGSRQGHDGL